MLNASRARLIAYTYEVIPPFFILYGNRCLNSCKNEAANTLCVPRLISEIYIQILIISISRDIVQSSRAPASSLSELTFFALLQ